MDMASAMGAIRHDDTNNNAAKFTVWPSGYAYKTVLGLTEAEVTAGKYRLVFVQANGDQFVFKWNGVADFTYEGYAVHTGTSDLADLGERVPKGLLLQIAYELCEKRGTYTFRIFLRKIRCGLNELSNAVEKVLNDANETFVKPAQEAGATVSLTPHGLGWPLEYAEFLCSEYGMAFRDAIETPVARGFALYAAYRQRNGGRHAGFDYLERAYAKSAEFKNSPLT